MINLNKPTYSETRTQEFYDIFVHGTGTEHEVFNLAEEVMLTNENLYKAAVKFIASEIGLQQHTSKLGLQAQISAQDYKDQCILDGSDKWSGQ